MKFIFIKDGLFNKILHELFIHYIITSRIYQDVREYVATLESDIYSELTNGKNTFGDKSLYV